jgi:superfamily II DNA or RNA helicase
MTSKQEALDREIYNNEEYSLYDRFRDFLDSSHLPNLTLSAVVGYFRSSGYFALKESLKSLTSIRVLVGIDTDRLSADWYRRGREQRALALRNLVTADLVEDIKKAGYRPEVEAGVQAFVADILAGRLEMRAYDQRVVHAKFYLFLPEDWTPGNPVGTLITGSSNFTAPGLGVHKEYNRSNYELNVELRSNKHLSFARDEFERLWADGTEILPVEVAHAVQTHTFLNRTAGPQDLFIKFLQEVFGEEVEYDGRNVEGFLPLGFMRLTYQIDAVNEGMRMLARHGGFLLADVVGLGKTVVAALLIFCQLRDLPARSRVLVVAPPVLLDNWQRTIAAFRFKTDRIDFLSAGSLHKVRNPEAYALVVVDEAHNFRNSATLKYEDLERLCKARGAFGRKKVILVSATPLNNQPLEILNLLALFQDVHSSTLPVGDLKAYFTDKQNQYDEIGDAEGTTESAEEKIRLLYGQIRDEVLSSVIIRRTRSDLMNHPAYAEDLAAQGIRFPQVQKPQALGYFLDSDLDDLLNRTLVLLTGDQIVYAYHKTFQYLTGPAAGRFDTRSNTYEQLGELLKRFFLKRLDSSFPAFLASLARFQAGIESHLKMLDEDRFVIASSVDVETFVGNDDPEGLAAELERHADDDPTITVCRAADFAPSFAEDLRADLAKVRALAAEWEPWARADRDPKVEALAKEIDHNFLKVAKNPGQRVVVFTESEDTALALEAALGRTDVLMVSAGNRDERERALRRNFDANLPFDEQENTYRVLITTDVLAEGVNLHRANTIVNYDTPWNSVRLFQRIGRVNRVGSKSDKVYIYNFFPQPAIDDVIELQKKARLKLQAFHSAFGDDAPIYSPHEKTGSFGLFNEFGEDPASGGANPRLDLLMELRAFRRDHPEDYERIAGLPEGVRGTRAGDRDRALVFLRNGERDAFYEVTDGPRLVSLIEAAAFLRPTATGSGLALADWGPWVKPARDLFVEGEEARLRDTLKGKGLSRAAAGALTYISGFLEDDSLSFDEALTAEERPLFELVRDRIQHGGAAHRFVKSVVDSRKHAQNLKLQLRPQVDHLVRLMKAYRYDIELKYFEARQLDLVPRVEEPRLVVALAEGVIPHAGT